MYQRRIRPYDYQLPGVPQRQPVMGYQPTSSASQTEGDRNNGTQMPNIPSGLLKEALRSIGGPSLNEGWFGASMAPSAMETSIASVAPDLGFSTPFLDSFVPEVGSGLMDSLAGGGAFDLGTAGTGAGGLLGGAGAAGESGLLASMAAPVAPIAIGAMLAKPFLQDDNPDMALLPAILHPNMDALFSPLNFLGDLF